MQSVIVYSDLRLGGPTALDYEDDIWADAHRENVVLLGDIVDMANCRDDRAGEYAELAMRLRQKFKSRYIPGPRERGVVGAPFYCVIDEAIYTHGEFELYGMERALQRYTGTVGRSAIGFHASGLADRAVSMLSWPLPSQFYARAVQLCHAHDVQVYVCAQSSIDEPVCLEVDDIQIALVPRGKVQLTLSE